jgi:isoleucyl-tRNA synthetase
MRFSSKGVEEVARRFLGTLRNLYVFFAQYANLDGYRPSPAGVPREERALLDRWVLSRLHATVATVRTELDRFELSRAGRAIEQFVIEDLSNWYVRRSRERFWAQGLAADKRAAFDTLFECLETVCRVAAPFVPFVAEDLYRGLTAGAGGEVASVHLTSFPEADESASEEELKRRMEDVRRVVRLGRAGRNRCGIKTRQPLARVRIGAPPDAQELGELTEIVLEELNVREAIPAPPGEIGCELSAKARFDVLGPRFGQAMKTAAAAIASLSTAEVAELERKGVLRIDVAGVSNEIRREEVDVSHVDPEGWVLERESGWTVALDLALDDELRAEGFAREVVNKIQFMRKKAGFGITDRIEVFYEATPIVREAIGRHDELIRRETLAARIEDTLAEGETRAEWKINGEPAVISLRRI